MSGMLNTISVNNAPDTNVDPGQKTQFTFRNEEFTALGNIGHLVRVPNNKHDSAGMSPSVNSQDLASLSGRKVTINGNPIEIIGVADMSRLDHTGNPHFFSFNPGTGSSAELQALQSALLGTAVDMSNFIPPPYMSDPSIHSTSVSAPSSASNMAINSVTAVETAVENTANNSLTAGTAAESRSVIDQQLDLLLSQGHSQANSQTDISAIMGQIDSAINDINRRSNASLSVSNDIGSFNSETSSFDTGLSSVSPADTVTAQPDLMYSGIDNSQSSASTFDTQFDNTGLSSSGGMSKDLDNSRFTGMFTNSQVESTLNNNVMSVADTSVNNDTHNIEINHSIRGNDIASNGIYPLEGNMAARYAPLASALARRLTKLEGRVGSESSNENILQIGKSTFEVPKLSHSTQDSKPGGISFTNVPGASASEGGTGIFAVSTLGDILRARGLLPQLPNSEATSSHTVGFGNKIENRQSAVDSIALDTSTKNSDSFALDKHLLGSVGSDISINRADSTGISNINTGNIKTSQISLDTRKMLNAGTGTISNNINASSNKITANNQITNNEQSAANLADAVAVTLAGSNGGPITNMVGIQSSDLTGMLPKPSATENFVPSGSFIVGAGQPNPTVISTGKTERKSLTSFSLSSRPDSMGTFSMGSMNQMNQNNIISEAVTTALPTELGVNTFDFASEMGGIGGTDPNATVIHTVTTVEEVTSVESTLTNSTSSSVSSSADQTSNSLSDTSASMFDQHLLDPVPDPTIGGFAVGSGRGGDFNVFQRMSLTSPALKTKDSVATMQHEILSDQKPVDFGSFVKPTVDQPKASPLVMGPAMAETGALIKESNPVKLEKSGTGSSVSQQTISSANSARVSIGSGLSVSPNKDAPGLPAKVSDQSQVVDLTKVSKPETRAKALPSQWSASSSSVSMDGFAVGQHTKPIVGNIFGSSGEAASERLTQKFLEQTGITKKPAMDFMTSFLNQDSKPSRNGEQNLQIVPLNAERKIGRSPSSMIVVGTGARRTEPHVDKFGVADITTRRQQLNRNQWSSFMSSRAQEPGIQTKYQTQNVIGASETRPLNGQGSLTTEIGNQEAASSVIGSGTNTQPVKTKRSKNAGLTVFEAPGMSGRSAVSVSTFNNRMVGSPATTLSTQRPFKTIDTSVNTVSSAPLANAVGVSDTQRSSSALAGAQATAIKTSEFANNFKRTLTSSGVPMTGSNTISQSGSIESVNSLAGQRDLSNLGPSAVSAQSIFDNARSNLALSDSMMIAESTARPGLQGPISTTNIERMRFGKPVVLNNKVVNTSVTETFGNLISTDNTGFMTQNIDVSPNRRGTITPVSNTPVIDNSLQNNQQMQATRFTSGNRFAVFGPANDVSGRSFRAKATSRQASGMRIGVLAPAAECRYMPDPASRYYFIYKNGVTQHRFRCALGTAFDEMTCECSIRVNDHGN